jgi:PGF-CTERM protein
MTSEGFVDIKVKTDQSATLTKLYNGSSGLATTYNIPLTGLFVGTNPWYWGNATAKVAGDAPSTPKLNNTDWMWNTGSLDIIGQRIYPAGVYTVTAEFNLNGMKDNYKNAGADYTGKTISEARTITLTSDTVKIEANKDSVVRSKPFSVTITGKPSTYYWVWVKGTSQMTGTYDDQPPLIPLYQSGVYNDSTVNLWYGNAFNPQNKNAPTYWAYQQVPTYPFNGSQYYVMIKTSESGTRTVEFSTSNQTKAQKYTIRVENWTLATGWKTDEVDVRVEKGAVTITASGDGSYYLGEEVKFSGTNTETVKTYLFITGPNLKADGSQIQSADPRNNAVRDGIAGDFQAADVKDDNTWSYKWGTATVALDAGTYTVYAVSGPRNKGTGNLNNVAYGTVSIIIKKPFVSATVSQSTVAKGDKIFVRGTAEGKPSPGVAMWVLGKNYATRDTSAVESDASFEFEIKDSTTTSMASGQYFIVVQHPMQNDQFDITLVGNNVNNLQLNAASTKIFALLGAGSLQGSDAAEALVQGINDPNVDDTYTKLQFLIEEPVIRIDAIGDRHVGDQFKITAQTNLAVDDEVLFEVYSSSFKPTQKSQSGEFSGATGTVKVAKGDTGMNKLEFDVDASTFKPDEYIVSASAVIQDATGTALFNVLEGQAPTAVPTTVAPTAVATTAAATTAAPTTVAPTKTPTQPGFGALVALIGLGAVAFLVVRKH